MLSREPLQSPAHRSVPHRNPISHKLNLSANLYPERSGSLPGLFFANRPKFSEVFVENHIVMKKNCLGVLLAVTCLVAASQLAFAHAVLVSSTPKIHGTMHGPSVDVDLKFNSRVDGAHSSLSLVMPDGGAQSLTLEMQGAPNELNAHTQLTPGKYTL